MGVLLPLNCCLIELIFRKISFQKRARNRTDQENLKRFRSIFLSYLHENLQGRKLHEMYHRASMLDQSFFQCNVLSGLLADAFSFIRQYSPLQEQYESLSIRCATIIRFMTHVGIYDKRVLGVFDSCSSGTKAMARDTARQPEGMN